MPRCRLLLLPTLVWFANAQCKKPQAQAPVVSHANVPTPRSASHTELPHPPFRTRWFGRSVWRSVAAAPDHQHFAVSTDRTLQLRNTSDGSVVWEQVRASAGMLAFSPDGQQIFEASLQLRTLQGTIPFGHEVLFRSYRVADGTTLQQHTGSIAPTLEQQRSGIGPPLSRLHALHSTTSTEWQLDTSYGLYLLREQNNQVVFERAARRSEAARVNGRTLEYTMEGRSRRLPLPCEPRTFTADPSLDRLFIDCAAGPDRNDRRVLQLSNGRPLSTFTEGPTNLSKTTFLDAQTLLLLSYVPGIATMHFFGGERVRTPLEFRFPIEPAKSIAIAPDGQHIAYVGERGTIELLERRTGNPFCEQALPVEFRALGVGFSDAHTLWLLSATALRRVDVRSCQIEERTVDARTPDDDPGRVYWLDSARSFLLQRLVVGGTEIVQIPVASAASPTVVPRTQRDDELLFARADGVLGLSRMVDQRVQFHLVTRDNVLVAPTIAPAEARSCRGHVVVLPYRSSDNSDTHFLDEATLRISGTLPARSFPRIHETDCYDRWLLAWGEHGLVVTDLHTRTQQSFGIEEFTRSANSEANRSGFRGTSAVVKMIPNERALLVSFAPAGWLEVQW